MKKLFIPFLLVIAISGWTFGIYRVAQGDDASTAAQTTTVPFDHSNCQYPNRLSNPPDGCDNTDPPNPQCMKGGAETCDIPFDSSPWNPDATTTPAPTTTSSPNTCGQ